MPGGGSKEHETIEFLRPPFAAGQVQCHETDYLNRPSERTMKDRPCTEGARITLALFREVADETFEDTPTEEALARETDRLLLADQNIKLARIAAALDRLAQVPDNDDDEDAIF